MANYKFKTTNIKGKDYVEVNQRVLALRTIADFKGFAIKTQLLHIDSESCVVQATILDAQGNVVAQGMAQEDKSSSRINQTSYVENCETSAVGRALGFLGIGIETSIATADEVDMAIKKQESKPAAKAEGKSDLTKAIEFLQNAKDEAARKQNFERIANSGKLSEEELKQLEAYV